MGAVLMGDELVHLAPARISAPRSRCRCAELPALTVHAFPALLMPAILLYGIYGGVTTPTEAAAVAAFYALILAAVFYRALTLAQSLPHPGRERAVLGRRRPRDRRRADPQLHRRLREHPRDAWRNALVDLDVHPLVFLLASTC